MKYCCDICGRKLYLDANDQRICDDCLKRQQDTMKLLETEKTGRNQGCVKIRTGCVNV